MTTADDINVIMSEVGPLDDDILEVLRTGDDSWTIRFEDVDIEAEFNPEAGRVMFASAIGAPPPLRALAVYEALLSYAMLWRDTGGLRMGLTGPGGEAVQMVDLVADGLQPGLVATVAANLAERTLIWRSFFQGAAGADVPPTASDLMTSNFIRI